MVSLWLRGIKVDAPELPLTLSAAEIWGMDSKFGSITKGKAANLILTNGTPLLPRTTVKRLFINGREVSLETRQTRLVREHGGERFLP